ncbi:extracellular solute-binding protein [Azospirillum sp. ST 5-10]|uniref:extracellular solute-binding protein n=1 Tax=unclassified Azospirillum TaxID=2630922 RepID=UPI003F49C44C
MLRAFLVVLGVLLAMPSRAAEIRLLTWADYLAPAVVEKFARETGIRIVVDPVVSISEMREKFRADPTAYDLVNPADYEIPILAREGLLDQIDASRLPGYANILDGWRSPPYDRKNEWSVPFLWGTTSLVVDTDQWSGPLDSVSLLFDPPAALKDKTGFLVGAEETLRLALLHLGLPQCTSDPAHLEQALALVRPLLAAERTYTISDAADALASGRIAVGIAWNGDALKARERRPSLRYLYPKEGLIIWSDTLVVPKGAAHRAEALRFIDFMLEPENAALQSNFTRYANAVRGSDAWMDADLLNAPEVIVPSHVRIRFFRSCDSEQLGLYAQVWDPVLRELRR